MLAVVWVVTALVLATEAPPGALAQGPVDPVRSPVSGDRSPAPVAEVGAELEFLSPFDYEDPDNSTKPQSPVNRTYAVVAPRVLRPNRDFHAAVSIFGSDTPVRVTVEVGGPQDAGGTILNRQVVEVQSDNTQVVKFQIGDLGPGMYNLTVNGYGGMSFLNSTRLEYIHKSYSVLIQTDRAIYRPGNVVQFRVVVVDPQLRPSVTGAIDIHISDGKGHIVKQWKRVFTNKGVYSDSLQLSEEPVHGDWNVTVQVLGQTTTKQFQVAEYVLPKFEVNVELPPFAVFDRPQFPATVKAFYTYGKPVKGEVTIQVTPTYKYGYLQAPYDDPIRKVVHIKGKADVTLHVFDDLKLKDDYAREVEVTAYVKEDLTGRTQNASAFITVYKHKYKMELIRTSDNFKPGLKYTAILKVAYQDDSPVQSGNVTIRHGFTHNTKPIETVYEIPESGIIPLEFYPPLDDDAQSLVIEAQYLDLTQWLGDIKRALSPSNSYLQASLMTQDVVVGGEVIVSINATQELVYYVYEVLGRGDVVFARTLQAYEGNSHTFRFIATASMAPRAQLVVYYIKADGEVVADSLHFEVAGALQNKVTLRVSPRKVDVADDVDIMVTAKPNSFVGLMGIDQRSLLLKSGNDITQAGIIAELEDYNPGRRGLTEEQKKYNPLLFNTYTSVTALDVFSNAGVVVLTNGMVYDFNPMPDTTSDGLPRFHAVNGPFGRLPPNSGVSTLKPDLGPALEYNHPTRPPLAGPYAFSFLPPPADDRPRVFLQRDIPATWLFEDAESRFNGVVTMRKKAPDSITSWVVSAFAIDDFHGLGVVEEPAKLTVFRPFFLSLNLPYSVVRGEAVAVELVVFNYGKSDVQASVVIENSGDFLFADFANEIDQASPAARKTREVTVVAGEGFPLSFMIIPLKLGYLDIKVSASSPNAADAVVQKLLVKPEGVRKTVNRAVLVDLRTDPSFSTKLPIELPNNVVNDSLAIEVSVVGDILGSAVMNLESLLELPTGCGEQNMVKLVPNIVLLEYLKKSNQLTSDLQGRAIRHMESGYQRQLTFRHDDGSFSAFGKRDKSGSTWLTAFVVRALHLASTHIDIEEEIIEKGVAWLAGQQESDGSFLEVGEINMRSIQGGAGSGVPLTAYVLISLLVSKDRILVRNQINKALDFLAESLETLEDPYSIAVANYALHVADHPYKDTAFYQLEAKAQVKEDMKWWHTEEFVKSHEETREAHALDVEMTAYALQVYMLRGLARDALPVMRWLIRQRNANGGFISTQDTVVGMQALADLAEQISAPSPDVNVRLIYGARGSNVQVNTNNAMVMQKVELPDDTKEVEVSASGAGMAILQLTYHFNLEVTGASPAFSLDPQVDRTADRHKLRLTACSGYTRGNESNMAVLDVTLPSGYVVDNDLIPGLYDYDHVKRVERKDGGTGVLIYFDKLTPVEVCPTVAAYRVNKVAFQKPAPVTIYDYYDLSRQARQFYQPLSATLCDICDLDECDPDQCEQQILELNRQRQAPVVETISAEVIESSAQGLLPLWLSLIAATFVAVCDLWFY
ncbi:CD109 antigen-like [Oratosquilla oratoria]|uniref:CD109 antigen-like n=1 Tax=Oratosquilla oratoria TaxID=337810 RepID=UPI003F75A3E7